MVKKMRISGKRQIEIIEAVGDRMDDLEARSWGLLQAEGEVGTEEAARRFPAPDLADTVDELLNLSDGNINMLVRALTEWNESNDSTFDGDEDRGAHMVGFYMGFALVGIGNLYGTIPEDALYFDSELQEEGRRRGWRSMR